MTITTYPGALTSDPNLTNLSLSRLLARLEHNLLSSSADLKPLRRSEYQRMRVGAVRLLFLSFLFFSFFTLRLLFRKLCVGFAC